MSICERLRPRLVQKKKRTKATEALDGYRLRVFPELQVGVNRYLQRFNAGFRIGNLAPVNIGGGFRIYLRL